MIKSAFSATDAKRVLEQISYWSGELALRTNCRTRGSAAVAERKLREAVIKAFVKMTMVEPLPSEQNDIIEGRP